MSKYFIFKFKYYNYRLILLVLALSSLGVVVIGSAVPGEGYQSKQIIGLIGGIILMFFLSIVDYQFWLKLHWLIYVVCIFLLTIVLIFGNNVNGATRWIPITDQIAIQPSEFAKILLILFWAWMFGKNPNILKHWKSFFVACLFSFVPFALIVKEPDLSTTLLVTSLYIVIIYISGFSYKKFAIIFAIFIPLVLAAVIYIQTPNQALLKNYQLNRILSFINPEEYDDLRHQQDNSVLAIGSGQLTGKGLYNDSTESVKNGNYLSEPQTDFIFAIVGEEMGFVGSCLIITFLILISIECTIIGARAPDLAGRIIGVGISSIITFQTFINIGVATELLPNTGIPLPFVSYGLSSLITMYAGIGLVLNIRIKKKISLEEAKYEHRINCT